MDSSVTLAWHFDDDRAGVARRALDLVNENSAIVPPVWSIEVSNILLMGERRNRATEADNFKFLRLLSQMPIAVDQSDPKPFESVMGLARTHKLSAYDAAYLELAARLGLPLASLDRDLVRAAHEAGVEVLTGA